MVSFPPTFKDPNYASQFSFPLELVAYKNEELSSPPPPKIDHSLEQGGGGQDWTLLPSIKNLPL